MTDRKVPNRKVPTMSRTATEHVTKIANHSEHMTGSFQLLACYAYSTRGIATEPPAIHTYTAV